MLINDTGKNPESNVFIGWADVYKTGISLIDKQHRKLINMTNDLYKACLTGKELQGAFKETMSKMVEYVRFHFSAELELLNRINYPDSKEHKKLHDELIQRVLIAANEYNEGKQFVPHNFVRVLREWVFGHIAIFDRNYSIFAKTQKSKGLLTDAQIEGNSTDTGVE